MRKRKSSSIQFAPQWEQIASDLWIKGEASVLQEADGFHLYKNKTYGNMPFGIPAGVFPTLEAAQYASEDRG